MTLRLPQRPARRRRAADPPIAPRPAPSLGHARALPAPARSPHTTEPAPSAGDDAGTLGKAAVKPAPRPLRAPVRAPARSWVEVDLAAIRHNVRQLRFLARPAKLAAVVKADAYGHGAFQVASAAVQAGAAAVCVFDLDEAEQLREQGFADHIIVFCPIAPHDAARAVGLNLAVTVADCATADALSRAAARFQRPARAHIYIDSGMSHHGLPPDRALALAAAIRSSAKIALDGVYTHFPSPADDPAVTLDALARFLEPARRINPHVLHAANTAPFLRFPQTALDMIRPGLALYGITPQPALDGLRPALRPATAWRTSILAVRDIPAGSPVSYGGAWTAERDTRIGVIGAGYAAGLPRSLAPGAGVLIHGRRAPIVGAICMDSCMVDLTDIPQANQGDQAAILGQDQHLRQTPADLARSANSIPHNILTNISPRLPRLYQGVESQPSALGAAAAGG